MVKLLSILIDAPRRAVDTQEATKAVVPDPSRAEPPVDQACDSLSQTSRELGAERPASLLSTLPIETAIRLRWALRDIKGNRTKLSPVSPEDLKALIDMGLVEMCDAVPAVTANGSTEIE